MALDVCVTGKQLIGFEIVATRASFASGKFEGRMPHVGRTTRLIHARSRHSFGSHAPCSGERPPRVARERLGSRCRFQCVMA